MADRTSTQSRPSSSSQRQTENRRLIGSSRDVAVHNASSAIPPSHAELPAAGYEDTAFTAAAAAAGGGGAYNMTNSFVQVMVRFRPLLGEEKPSAAVKYLISDTNTKLVVRRVGDKISSAGQHADEQEYKFQQVFGPTATDDVVYDKVAPPLLEHVRHNRCATLIMYGQTGSGKTYTMTQVAGPLIESLFKTVHQYFLDPEVHIAAVQVYLDLAYDLLSANARQPRGAQIDRNARVYPTQRVHSAEQAISLVLQAEGFRAKAPHALNKFSSRSHSIITFRVKHKLGEVRLYLVDLAGSERAHKTMGTDEVFREGIAVNRSLLTLSRCIEAMANNSDLIPTRESTITHMLGECFGGGALTFVCCANPSLGNESETKSTLTTADIAKKVRLNRKQFAITRDPSLQGRAAVENEALERLEEALVNMEQQHNLAMTSVLEEKAALMKEVRNLRSHIDDLRKKYNEERIQWKDDVSFLEEKVNESMQTEERHKIRSEQLSREFVHMCHATGKSKEMIEDLVRENVTLRGKLEDLQINVDSLMVERRVHLQQIDRLCHELVCQAASSLSTGVAPTTVSSSLMIPASSGSDTQTEATRAGSPLPATGSARRTPFYATPRAVTPSLARTITVGPTMEPSIQWTESIGNDDDVINNNQQLRAMASSNQMQLQQQQQQLELVIARAEEDKHELRKKILKLESQLEHFTNATLDSPSKQDRFAMLSARRGRRINVGCQSIETRDDMEAVLLQRDDAIAKHLQLEIEIRQMRSRLADMPTSNVEFDSYVSTMAQLAELRVENHELKGALDHAVRQTDLALASHQQLLGLIRSGKLGNSSSKLVASNSRASSEQSTTGIYESAAQSARAIAASIDDLRLVSSRRDPRVSDLSMQAMASFQQVDMEEKLARAVLRANLNGGMMLLQQHQMEEMLRNFTTAVRTSGYNLVRLTAIVNGKYGEGTTDTLFQLLDEARNASQTKSLAFIPRGTQDEEQQQLPVGDGMNDDGAASSSSASKNVLEVLIRQNASLKKRA